MKVRHANRSVYLHIECEPEEKERLNAAVYPKGEDGKLTLERIPLHHLGGSPTGFVGVYSEEDAKSILEELGLPSLDDLEAAKG